MCDILSKRGTNFPGQRKFEESMVCLNSSSAFFSSLPTESFKNASFAKVLDGYGYIFKMWRTPRTINLNNFQDKLRTSKDIE